MTPLLCVPLGCEEHRCVTLKENNQLNTSWNYYRKIFLSTTITKQEKRSNSLLFPFAAYNSHSIQFNPPSAVKQRSFQLQESLASQHGVGLPPIKSGPPVSCSGIDYHKTPFIELPLLCFKSVLLAHYRSFLSTCREPRVTQKHSAGLTYSLFPDVRHLNTISWSAGALALMQRVYV